VVWWLFYTWHTLPTGQRDNRAHRFCMHHNVSNEFLYLEKYCKI
jgi:hypothetical protein